LPSISGLPSISLPALPTSLPSIPGLTTSGSGGSNCILGICLGGANRAATTSKVQRYSVKQLTSTFDPALVSWYLTSLGGAQ
jgi:hypothetical protein